MEREEAIRRIKAWNLDSDDMEVLTVVIPELAESEDERIRKEIISYILYKADGVSEEDEHRWVTWLEKQKDLDKMIVVSPEVWDMAIFDAYENGKKEGVKQKEPHYTKRNALFDKCVENCDPEVMKEVSDEIDEMLEKEQKPSHKFNVGDIIHCKYDDREFTIKSVDLANGVYKYTKEGCGNDIDYADENFELVEQKPAEWSEDVIRKAVKEVGLTQYQINWFKSNVFPPKQEWSEEDEQYLLVCKNALSKYERSDGWDAYIISTWLEKRLKSLRPQPKQGRSKDIKQTTKNTHPEEYPLSFAECISPREYSLFKQLQQDCIETIEQELYSLGKEHEKDHDPRIKFLKSLKPSWKPSAQELGALKTAVSVLTEERTFPKAAAQIQKIIDVFDGKELRKDWKPSEEQMEALKAAMETYDGFEEYDAMKSLYKHLKKLM